MSKQQQETVWVSEKQAAEMLHLNPVYMRRQIKSGAIPVNYTRLHRLCHQYDKASIEAYIISCSTLMKTRPATRQAQTVN